MSEKILVVDDEPDIVTVMKFTLETKGFKVITAYDGEEGLRKAKSDKPELIILDMLMPKMYGSTLISRLENIPETKDIPVILLSCLVNDNEDGTKHNVGGRVLLSKFCSEDELLYAVNKALGRDYTK